MEMEEIIFEDYGMVIIKRNGRYYIKYDAGELAAIMRENEITEDEVEKAKKSEQDAYEVILASEERDNSHP
jgi:hypothetical protein